MAKANHEIEDFLIQMAEDPAKAEEFKTDPSKVLSSFDFPDDVKSDIVSGKLEIIRRIHKNKHPKGPNPMSYALDPDFDPDYKKY